MKRVVLTDREADLMLVLWEQGPCTVAEVREGLSDELAYTTVLTILRTLESKGYVDHKAEGKAHRFFPKITEVQAQRSALSQLSRRLFRGSTELLVTQLIATEKISAAELERIKELLNRHKKGQRK